MSKEYTGTERREATLARDLTAHKTKGEEGVYRPERVSTWQSSDGGYFIRVKLGR